MEFITYTMEFIILLIPLAILLLMALALKDIFTRPMEQTHQILWTIVILVFPVLGVCAYYFAKSLGVKQDPRTTYRERYEKRFEEIVEGKTEEEKEEPKKTRISTTNLVLLIIVVYLVLIVLYKLLTTPVIHL